MNEQWATLAKISTTTTIVKQTKQKMTKKQKQNQTNSVAPNLLRHGAIL
jgi:hypothetical protein